MEEYDVFVFGTGTAGKLVATQCSDAGQKVAIIDNQDYGGTCSQRGCDPKKLMLASIEAYDLASSMKGDGIAGDTALDFTAAHHYARRYTESIPDKTEQNLKEKGISCYHGEAAFIDEKTIVLDGKHIKAKRFVIATGLKTRPLTIPGNHYALDSAAFFTVKTPPKKVAFIGGGYIGMEFAHMLTRAGSKVTTIETSDRILNPFEDYTAAFIEKASENIGIELKKNATASSIEASGDQFTLYYYQDDTKHQITVDIVFNTSGRVPSIDALQLDKAGVVTNEKGIVVNEYLQSTSRNHFYACGDVSNQSLPLTPLSGIEAQVVAQNLISNSPLSPKTKLEIPQIPSAVFTIPNAAGVGITEQQAQEQNLYYTTIEKDGNDWFNNKRINGSQYAIKIILEKDTDLILGAHITSHEAAETINIFAMALRCKMTLKDLEDTIFTYPSWANDLLSLR